MTRAFYPASRSHHAYVMAIDFGMKFKTRNGFWTLEGLVNISPESGYKIEVADESLSLLECRVGDLIEYEFSWEVDEGVPEKRAGIVTRMESVNVYLTDGTILWPSDGRFIIQRDGLPFHYPQVES